MDKYIHPETCFEALELPQLLCDSMTGSSIEDFTDAEEIEW
jgi:hypothetical protein